jgi:hypothetical protein
VDTGHLTEDTRSLLGLIFAYDTLLIAFALRDYFDPSVYIQMREAA